MTLWQAALLCPPFSTLTYAAPEELVPAHPGQLGGADPLQPGLRVAVPLGRTRRAAVLLEPADAPPAGVAVKPFIWPLERRPLLDADYLAMVRELGARIGASPGKVLDAVLPAGLRELPARFRVEGASGTMLLDLAAVAGAHADLARELAAAWLDGRMQPDTPRARDEVCFRPTGEPPWPLRPGAKRQIALLEHLHRHGPATRRMLTRALGPSAAPALEALRGKGLIEAQNAQPAACPIPDDTEASELAAWAPWSEVKLTEEQAAALGELESALDAAFAADHSESAAASWLVFGVTGSGKTLLYMRLAARCLAAGRSVLLLAPEVALACSLARAAAAAFPDREVRLHHGQVAPSRREGLFRELGEANAESPPELVVGTRSALFLPLPRLGLMVLDEEHDESFKQEERLPYHAKEVAWFRVQRAGGLLVLGSATPDVKSFHASLAGHLPAVRLAKRVHSRPLPDVSLVPLGENDPLQAGLAPQSVAALGEVLAAGEQAIIMLNRRGYAPVMYCLGCEQAVVCPHCKVGLTWHKRQERLVCHYCGEHLPFPLTCPECGGGHFIPLGEGTEQIEERLGEVLPPDTRVLRLDRDAARSPEHLEAVLDAFGRGEAQVLVGTQMLSKGHHFPNVTLAVVAEADLGLNLPDYRAMERTFQLLVQVSGRAGRGERPGRVLIQTRSPQHAFWQHVLAADYEGFYAREIARRRLFGYPPFQRLGLIRISHPVDWDGGPAAIATLAEQVRAGAPDGVKVLGPTPAPLAQIKGRKRFQCLIKAPDWPAVRAVYAAGLRAVPRSSPLRLSLDLDPVNML